MEIYEDSYRQENIKLLPYETFISKVYRSELMKDFVIHRVDYGNDLIEKCNILVIHWNSIFDSDIDYADIENLLNEIGKHYNCELVSIADYRIGISNMSIFKFINNGCNDNKKMFRIMGYGAYKIVYGPEDELVLEYEEQERKKEEAKKKKRNEK